MIRKLIKKILAPIVREILREEFKSNASQEAQDSLLRLLNDSLRVQSSKD
jgi:hypothetical protein